MAEDEAVRLARLIVLSFGLERSALEIGFSGEVGARSASTSSPDAAREFSAASCTCKSSAWASTSATHDAIAPASPVASRYRARAIPHRTRFADDAAAPPDAPHVLAELLGIGMALGINAATQAVEITITCGPSGSDVEFCLKHAQAWASKTGHTIKNFSPPTSPTEKLALYRQLFAAKSTDIDVLQIDTAWPGILKDHLVDLKPYSQMAGGMLRATRYAASMACRASSSSRDSAMSASTCA